MPRQRPPAAPLELPRGEGAGEALAAELKQRHLAGATFAALAEALCSGAEASLGGEGTPGGSIVEGRAGQSVADGLLAAVEAFIAQGIVGGPLVHVTLESLERVCAVERPRRAFSATRQAPHVGCAASRRRAARMVASAAAMSNHVGGGLAGGGGKALEPRAVARLAHAVGLTREDLVHHGQEVEAVGRGRGTAGRSPRRETPSMISKALSPSYGSWPPVQHSYMVMAKLYMSTLLLYLSERITSGAM